MVFFVNFEAIYAEEFEHGNSENIEMDNQKSDILPDEESGVPEYNMKNVSEDGHPLMETITKEPTCTEDGEKTIKCPCGLINRTETIPATGHNYEDGKCTKCGGFEAGLYDENDILLASYDTLVQNMESGGLSR